MDRNNLNQELVLACKNKDLAKVSELIDMGADVHCTDQFSIPLLVVASGMNCPEIVTKLLAAGADPNVQTCILQTSLIVASHKGYLAVMESLLTARADPNFSGTNGDTALTVAHDAASVHLLIDAKARIDQSGELDTPLTRACSEYKADVIDALISAGADVNKQSNQGYTSLMSLFLPSSPDTPRAAMASITRLLLSAGAKVDAGNLSNKSVLHYATDERWAGNPDALEAFRLIVDAYVQQRARGNTATVVGFGSGSPPPAADSDPLLELVSFQGVRALDQAVRHGMVEHVAALLDAGSSVMHQNWNKQTIVFTLATANASVSVHDVARILQLLVRAGADPYAVDVEGGTVLLRAVSVADGGASVRATEGILRGMWELLKEGREAGDNGDFYDEEAT
jgi:ankyrin repeat protein